MRRSLQIFVLGLAVFAGAGMAAADEKRLISVTGVGEVNAAPDMAIVSAGVTHQDPQAEQAMARASDGAARVLKQLEAAGIAARDVQTSHISLDPVWSDRETRKDEVRVVGFVARITMRIRVRDIDKLGVVLDSLVRDGANQLGGIQFGFRNPEPLMDDARRDAVADGRARAALLAEAAGVSLGRLQSMSEQGAVGRPQMMEMAARDAGVPIAPGEMSLSARVSMIYEIDD